MKHIQTWLLITLLALSANGVANAKLASGHQNLGSGLHQSQTVLNGLLHQGLEQASTTDTSGSPLATKGLDEARVARDALSSSASKLSNSKRPATVTAGVNTKTGEVAARACGGGKCAEDHVVDALGGNKANVRFTEAVRPRTGEQVPVCTRCEGNFGRGAFPEKTTKFQSDQ